MGFLSNLLSSQASSTVTPGQGGGGSGQGMGFLGANKFVELMKQAQLLNALPSSSTATLQPTAPLQPTPGLPATNWGSLYPGSATVSPQADPQPRPSYTGIASILDPTFLLKSLRNKQLEAETLQNTPAYLAQLPQATGYPYGSAPVAAHMGGFIHQHPLPGERILR